MFGCMIYFNVFVCVSILQKQSKDRFGLDGDEESTMLEESVSPKKSVSMMALYENGILAKLQLIKTFKCNAI